MLKQHLQLKLAQKLSPQQIQLMKLIQLPTQAFEQRIRQELEENPALEKGKEALESDVNDDFEDDLYDNDSQEIDAQDVNIDDYLSDDEIPDYKTQSNNYAEQEEREIPYAAGQSFYQSLIDQLNQQMTTEREWLIGAFLIGSIDESGYLRRPMLDLLDDLAFNENLIASEQEVAQVIIQHLHKLDPAGVGARTLEECLLIQLSRKTPTEAVKNAVLLLTEAFDAFTKKHYDKIMTRLKWHEETLRDALNEIEKLNPKPGSAFTEQGKITEHIIPDFTLLVQDGSIDIQLNGRNAPELHVSQTYQTLMHTYNLSTFHPSRTLILCHTNMLVHGFHKNPNQSMEDMTGPSEINSDARGMQCDDRIVSLIVRFGSLRKALVVYLGGVRLPSIYLQAEHIYLLE